MLYQNLTLNFQHIFSTPFQIDQTLSHTNSNGTQKMLIHRAYSYLEIILVLKTSCET